MSLQIQTSRVEPEIVVVTLSGRITAGPESQTIEPLVNDLLRQNERKLIFDLTGVRQIDSVGAGIIVRCFFTMQRAGGGLRLAGATTKVARLFKVRRLDTLLPFYPTVAAACEGFKVTPKASE